MLISLNGKRVGGMMVTELMVDLEISGPVLTLVVSRYKFSASAEDRLREAEKHYLKAVDEALSDQRRLGWIDLVARSANGSTSSGPGLTTATLVAKSFPDPSKQIETIFRDAPGIQDEIQRGNATQLSLGGNVQDHDFNSKTSIPSTLPCKSDVAPECLRRNSSMAEARNDSSVLKDRYGDAPGQTAGSLRQTWGVAWGDMTPLGAKPLHSSEEQHFVSRPNLSAYQGRVHGANHSDCVDIDAKRCETGLNEAVELFALSTSDDAQNNDLGLTNEADDYENAWMGCVCGVVHERDVPVFWIQCDNCQSWYNVSPHCVEFNEADAANLPSWTCWGCPPSSRATAATDETQVTSLASLDVDVDVKKNEDISNESCFEPDNLLKASSSGHSARPCGSTFAGDTDSSSDLDSSLKAWSEPPKTRQSIDRAGCRRPKSMPKERKDGTVVRPRGPAPSGCRWDKKTGYWVPDDRSSPSDAVNKEAAQEVHAVTKTVDRAPMQNSSQRKRGDPSESVPEMMPKSTFEDRILSKGEIVCVREHGPPDHGIATVLNTYVNGYGHRLYDVKYIVGRKEKGIFAQFVTPHHF
jgi:hypothetical protein